jgi:hypothetical protein
MAADSFPDRWALARARKKADQICLTLVFNKYEITDLLVRRGFVEEWDADAVAVDRVALAKKLQALANDRAALERLLQVAFDVACRYE